ncbi:hypothetical protein AGMMS49992_32540 [Clostridia bacterium]|nr:hypothetical protein AGMMS49992_32540 [Clostridia bacterium]
MNRFAVIVNVTLEMVAPLGIAPPERESHIPIVVWSVYTGILLDGYME